MSAWDHWFEEPTGASSEARDAMRSRLVRHVVQRRKRRKFVRAAAAALLVAGLSTWAFWRTSDGEPRPQPRGETPKVIAPFVVEIVETDRSAFDAWRVETRPQPEMLIDDRGLVEWLERAGSRPSIARVGDRVMLMDQHLQ